VGQVTAAGDEVSFIQRLDANSFHRMDFTFFTGSAAVARAQWQMARKAGASIIDLTYALEAVPDVLVRSPLVEQAMAGKPAVQSSMRVAPDLKTTAVVAAHPAAVLLGLVAARLQTAAPVMNLAATVLEPASEYGRLAMDELHKQTVNLLSFQELPKEQYDAQVSFNLLPAAGEEAKMNFARTEQRIREHYAVAGEGMLPSLSLQLVHAPVFHGYTASVLIEMAEPVALPVVEAALSVTPFDLMQPDSDPPSNLSAAGQEDILVRVREADDTGRRFWLWLAVDNLNLAARNAIACALELRRLRPQGKVQ
jgi:aspartate-semialdehyde dehydrogenase